MRTFDIPETFYIGKDEWGDLYAYDFDDFGGKIYAEIEVRQTDGLLGACTPEEYLANLRQRALDAYENGETVIDA